MRYAACWICPAVVLLIGLLTLGQELKNVYQAKNLARVTESANLTNQETLSMHPSVSQTEAKGDSFPQDDTIKQIESLRAMYLKEPQFWERAWVDDGVEYREIGALPQTPPYPESNPYTPAKAKLGEKLFYDPILSLSEQIACATCHDSELGFSNARSVSFGHNRALGNRNVPSVVMSAFGKEKFWDGRAQDLESQSLMPIENPIEMADSLQNVIAKLKASKEYQKAFSEVFGESSAQDSISLKHLAQALATYERSLMPKNSRFDRFVRGDSQILRDDEVLGLHIFRTKGRCMNCHNGVEFSDHKYHNLGLTYYGREKYEDFGRYNVSKNPSDMGAFKTPSLREVRKSAPYFHNGLFPTLRGVLNAYNFGMFRPEPTDSQKNDPLFPQTSPLLKELKLTQEEIDALEAFLKTL